MSDLFTNVQEDKLECIMRIDGTVKWKYYLWNERKNRQEVLLLDHKTAVTEIEIQQLSITARKMQGDDLVVTYTR